MNKKEIISGLENTIHSIETTNYELAKDRIAELNAFIYLINQNSSAKECLIELLDEVKRAKAKAFEIEKYMDTTEHSSGLIKAYEFVEKLMENKLQEIEGK